MEAERKNNYRCGRCEHFVVENKTHKSYYGYKKYSCPENKTHGARPNRKACDSFKDKFMPEIGDLCERYAVRIKVDEKIGGFKPCNSCDIRCIFAADKSERNYLNRKEDATQTTDKKESL